MKVVLTLTLTIVNLILSKMPSALACAVCFGDPNSKTSKAVTVGVLFLLGLIVFVLGWIAYTIVVWSRRARKLQDPTKS